MLRRKPPGVSTKRLRSGRINASDSALFTRQLATMLSAGLPLLQSLELLAQGSDHKRLRSLILALAAQVNGGTSLASSLRKHPQVFDGLYCDLVDAGEQSGSLDASYQRIADYREKAQALQAKINKALVYPAAVIAVAVAVSALLLIYVVPQFATLFADFEAELPALTQFVIDLAARLEANFVQLLGALLGALWLFKRAYAKHPALRDRIDSMALQLPIIGTILRQAAVARFARTLATTSAAGVALMKALECAAAATANARYRNAVLSMRDSVNSGMPIHVAMQNSGLFPTMAIQLVFIGEQAGSLEAMLTKVAAAYEQQVDNLVDHLTALLEPMIMVVIGVLVGGLIVAMYLPIFSLGKVVG
jgi:type IV pilus assembly protein PilC